MTKAKARPGVDFDPDPFANTLGLPDPLADPVEHSAPLASPLPLPRPRRRRHLAVWIAGGCLCALAGAAGALIIGGGDMTTASQTVASPCVGNELMCAAVSTSRPGDALHFFSTSIVNGGADRRYVVRVSVAPAPADAPDLPFPPLVRVR